MFPKKSVGTVMNEAFVLTKRPRLYPGPLKACSLKSEILNYLPNGCIITDRKSKSNAFYFSIACSQNTLFLKFFCLKCI